MHGLVHIHRDLAMRILLRGRSKGVRDVCPTQSQCCNCIDLKAHRIRVAAAGFECRYPQMARAMHQRTLVRLHMYCPLGSYGGLDVQHQPLQFNKSVEMVGKKNYYQREFIGASCTCSKKLSEKSVLKVRVQNRMLHQSSSKFELTLFCSILDPSVFWSFKNQINARD